MPVQSIVSKHSLLSKMSVQVGIIAVTASTLFFLWLHSTFKTFLKHFVFFQMISKASAFCENWQFLSLIHISILLPFIPYFISLLIVIFVFSVFLSFNLYVFLEFVPDFIHLLLFLSVILSLLLLLFCSNIRFSPSSPSS